MIALLIVISIFRLLTWNIFQRSPKELWARGDETIALVKARPSTDKETVVMSDPYFPKRQRMT